MVDENTRAGFVVVAPEWQTYGQRRGDDEVESVIRSAIGYLQNRSDVDTARLGLTGFCAGGRYTMLFLPQMHKFGAGVAWKASRTTAALRTAPRPSNSSQTSRARCS